MSVGGAQGKGRLGGMGGNTVRIAWGFPLEPLRSVGVVHVKALTRVFPNPDSIPSQAFPNCRKPHFLDVLATDLA